MIINTTGFIYFWYTAFLFGLGFTYVYWKCFGYTAAENNSVTQLLIIARRIVGALARLLLLSCQCVLLVQHNHYSVFTCLKRSHARGYSNSPVKRAYAIVNSGFVWILSALLFMVVWELGQLWINPPLLLRCYCKRRVRELCCLLLDKIKATCGRILNLFYNISSTSRHFRV